MNTPQFNPKKLLRVDVFLFVAFPLFIILMIWLSNYSEKHKKVGAGVKVEVEK